MSGSEGFFFRDECVFAESCWKRSLDGREMGIMQIQGDSSMELDREGSGEQTNCNRCEKGAQKTKNFRASFFQNVRACVCEVLLCCSRVSVA